MESSDNEDYTATMDVDKDSENINDATKGEPRVRGMPKSGRWWKKEHKQRHTAIIKVKPLKYNLLKREKEKLLKQAVKARQEEIRQSIAAEKAEKIAKRKEQEERRKANMKKSEIVQVIRNTNKLKHMKNKKKNLRSIEMRDTN